MYVIIGVKNKKNNVILNVDKITKCFKTLLLCVKAEKILLIKF